MILSPRVLVHVLVFLAMAAVSGCGSSTSPQQGEPGEPQSKETPPPSPEIPELGSTLGGRKGKPTTPSKPGPSTETGYGHVTLRSLPGEETTVVAGFWDGQALQDSFGADNCRVTTAAPSNPLLDVSAGQLTISVGGGGFQLDYLGQGQGYLSKTVALAAPSPGTAIIVSTTGATVPGFIGPIEAVGMPVLLTSTANGIAASAAFDVAWEPMQNADRVSVKLQGDAIDVVCVADAPATQLTIPSARVAQVAAHPRASVDCASCLRLSVTGISEVSLSSGDYAIALRHESSVAAQLAVH